MLNERLQRLLESIKDIPSIPTVASEVLRAMENPLVGAKDIGKIVDKDQSLTIRILRLANSPIYGFARQISTIDLAIVILGMDNLREIIMSYIVQGFFSKINTSVFNTMMFWEYSLLSASAARIVGRKLKYKLVGEAFIAALMHDIGIVIIAEYFTDHYLRIKQQLSNGQKSLIEIENEELGANHAEIGGWLAEKWNLPENLCNAIKNHHKHYTHFDDDSYSEFNAGVNFGAVKQPLTAIISISEWIAYKMGYSQPFLGEVLPEFYLAEELFSNLSEHDFINENSQFNLIINDVKEEFKLVLDELRL